MAAGDQELVYRVKTIADLQALERTRAATEKCKKALADQGKESKEVEKKLHDLDKALTTETAKALKLADAFNQVAAAERKAGRSSAAFIQARNQALQGAGLSAPGRFGEAKMAFLGAGGGVAGLSAAASSFGPQGVAAAGVAAITYKAATAAIREYATAEESVVRMDAALAQAGLLTDEYRTKLQALAGQLQNTTSIADEEWAAVITRLTQFGSTPGNIEANVEAVKNLAGIMNGDLQAAALAVGKALSGEFEAFTRLGIEFDKNATQAQKLDHLYKELAQRGHGMLEAAAQSLNGQVKHLRNSFGDLLEAIGPHIVKMYGLRQATDILSTAFEFWAQKIGTTIPIAGNLQNAVKKTTEAMADGKTSAKNYAEELESVRKKAAESSTFLSQLQQLTRMGNDEDQAAADLQIAEIKQKESAGLISPETSQRAQEQIRNETESKRHAREQAARVLSIRSLEAAGTPEALQQANSLRTEGVVRDRIYGLEGRTRQANSGTAPFGPSVQGGLGPMMSDQDFARSASGANPEQLASTFMRMASALQQYEGVVQAVSRMDRVGDADRARADNAARRIDDISRKMQILESQARNGAGR